MCSSKAINDFEIGELKPMDVEQQREYGHKMVNFILDCYKNNENSLFSIKFRFS
ncbi:hypothetical protein A4A49_64889 [Nicotiana attenuata]|uniref:Uncharacterized protein n=1 Tax=Nicotiana attenuata TaxID=49451 RepID=A0A1J6JVA3_NICAT|nr:hypothetical protein A4A49_66147 [Nicotiana attenuata]OIT21669.1 hypothetical protein A4A49_64889 [Nicotiana attenuata]